ncbi:MAG: hypothetical protein H0V29_07090, partial [Thermoleophilaceae bacterium]|nr:hypothetical protein [Thermoleophilaceae bacterium]
PGGAAGGAPGGSAADAEQFKEYSDCIGKADSSDVQAIQKCSELLK